MSQGQEPCPGCGARFAPFDGPTHRYIGASAACWALHGEVLIGASPNPGFLATSSVPPRRAVARAVPPGADFLLVDAYAAQHHGVPSPQAIQSVAVHLLVLHGVIGLGVAATSAQWVRQRALRRRGVYHWLVPPPQEALTLRHAFPGEGVERPCTIGEYAVSVYHAWHRAHGGQLHTWYQAQVLRD